MCTHVYVIMNVVIVIMIAMGLRKHFISFMKIQWACFRVFYFEYMFHVCFQSVCGFEITRDFSVFYLLMNKEHAFL